MNQLFYNLIGNALKFSREEVPPVITISSRMLHKDELAAYPLLNYVWEYCEITVADNGIGFGEQYKEQIFEIFQRLHTKDQFEGTGIGLALCKKITMNHGGTITAESEEGEGSTFKVILPVKRN
jgi:two-component system CheB/CheR fusion protein